MTVGEPPFLRFGAPDIHEEDIDEVVATLRSGWLGTGPRVAAFEKAFADYKGAPHAVAVNSCTAALHLSLLAAGIGPGDEVVTTPLTFCATANTILHVGARPVLADVDPVTQNIDPEKVKERITPRTKALLPVHFAGRACDMRALGDLAADHSLRIVEDCAHAIETKGNAGPAGTWGDFGCFSFYATKNVATGEGGMALVRDAAEAERLRVLSLHGMSRHAWDRYGSSGFRLYDVVAAGHKYNMMDIQAALGLHQLARVEDNWGRRRNAWQAYQSGLAGLPLRLPAEPEAGTRHAHHLYTVQLAPEARIGRDAFLQAMHKRGIGVGVHYQSLPEHTFYREHLGWHPDGWPEARDIGRRTVSLPLMPQLTGAETGRVVAAAREALA